MYSNLGLDAGYYDFILMDVQMPVMDGRTAARTIRGLARTDAQDIPIFALSADAFIEDERLSIKSGMNGHYAKPIDFAELQRSIGALKKMRICRMAVTANTVMKAAMMEAQIQ